MHNPLHFQRGQSMSEFMLAMLLVFLPLVLGLIYVGKYSDIKHHAIMASRFAALERALDPNSGESDQVIQDETVARFFRDGSKETIARNETTTQDATLGDEDPNWSKLDGNPLIQKYSDISVKLTPNKVDSNLLTPIDTAAQTIYNGLNPGFGVRSEVRVPLVNVANFDPLSGINLEIKASTVMAGDPWTSSSTQGVADRFNSLSVPARALKILSDFPVLNDAAKFLLDTGLPEFGCIKPDVVPQGAAPGAKYDPMDDSGVNKCR